jgi:hypothetical protein
MDRRKVYEIIPLYGIRVGLNILHIMGCEYYCCFVTFALLQDEISNWNF